MLRKWSVVAIVLLVAVLVVAGAVHAKNTKYTFNDVEIETDDGALIVEIEASVKDTNKSDYSQCSYYTDDFEDHLGQYAEDVIAGETAEEVLDFCVNNFENRS